MKVDGVIGAKFFDVLQALLVHSMPGVSDDQLLDILWQRAEPDTDDSSDILLSDEVRDLFDPSVLTVVDHHTENKKKTGIGVAISNGGRMKS